MSPCPLQLTDRAVMFSVASPEAPFFLFAPTLRASVTHPLAPSEVLCGDQLRSCLLLEELRCFQGGGTLAARAVTYAGFSPGSSHRLRSRVFGRPPAPAGA